MSSQFKRDVLFSVSIDGGTKLVGVFGFPVEHSLSPAMHNSAFAALHLHYIYVPFCVAPSNLATAIGSLKSLGIIGVNLTIPHKEAVLPYLNEITAEAREVGAVNTVHCLDSGRLVGDNTDGYGFFAPLADLGWNAAGSRIVVLGAGGAARSVVFRLAREGARVTIANRTQARAQKLAQAVRDGGYRPIEVVDWSSAAALFRAISESEMVVQTTRIGMHPEVENVPQIPFEALSDQQLVYDLVYNPAETALLREARSRGCRTINGVKMLVHQGAAAFHRWTGKWPPVDVMERVVLESME